MATNNFTNETAYAVIAEVYHNLSKKYDDGLTVAVGFEDNKNATLVYISTRDLRGKPAVVIFYNKTDGEFYQATFYYDNNLKEIDRRYNHLDMTGVDTEVFYTAVLFTVMMAKSYEEVINPVKAA